MPTRTATVSFFPAASKAMPPALRVMFRAARSASPSPMEIIPQVAPAMIRSAQGPSAL